MAEEFRHQLGKHHVEQLNATRNLANQQIALLEKIDDVTNDFDVKLALLYRLKLDVEKCILAEELKILRHDENLAQHEKLEREEEKLK